MITITILIQIVTFQDVAAEIIYTLGQAFEVAYCLATNQHLDMANMTSIGVKFSNSTI
jgi:hypothetical protein